jgi:starch-binding outer membrane protein, SusD/RagB family
MNKITKYSIFSIVVIAAVLLFMQSCKDFLDPKQEIAITEDQLFDDWYEYRAIDLGLYGLQQKLVEQLVVLGELRSDMLKITPNADADLVAIYNFNFSEDNKYVSPTNFFKLISASNNFIRVLEREHPEVLDKSKPTTNYDKLYGEALCMRAWAYFNAVRIYGKVPYIPESLVTMDEINKFINTPGTYIDSVYIEFSTDGYYNDTIYNHPVTLDKQLLDEDRVITMFTKELETKVKGVGVIHYINNLDYTWETTIWSIWSWHALLGQMYLFQGNLASAVYHFERIVNDARTSDNQARYQLDNSFANGSWSMIFGNVDNDEHIFTLWFEKNYFQQNDFQNLFEPWAPHKYMLKPTRQAVMKWETVWANYSLIGTGVNARIGNRGRPNDQYRGNGSSYAYFKGQNILPYGEVQAMLNYKAQSDLRSATTIMEGYDTMVYKYTIRRELYDQDANFIVYRAGGIHLYLAEAYVFWVRNYYGNITASVPLALNLLNDGTYYSQLTSRTQRGVRGRVGLPAVNIMNDYYTFDPITNDVLSYQDLALNPNSFKFRQQYIEERILDERARELAFEGERFYDLMRIAKRRNDPSFLASKVSEKFPAGSERTRIYNYLLDENNWYIHIFE